MVAFLIVFIILAVVMVYVCMSSYLDKEKEENLVTEDDTEKKTLFQIYRHVSKIHFWIFLWVVLNIVGFILGICVLLFSQCS